MSQISENKLITEIEKFGDDFSKLMQKLVKDIKRQEKIMARADKRQKQEYDELQKKLLEVQELQLAQRELMDSFIKLIAGAIDAKSAYTGGHCERVPEIALMLAKEAHKNSDIPFEIKNEDEEREISIAAWLHDCGKVVTPEYVVDKSVKLETIYNRIHEIRMRFEVIYRDKQIQALERKLNGDDETQINQWLEDEYEKLKEDFEFIANVNIGGEFLDEKSKNKIKQIAKTKWIAKLATNDAKPNGVLLIVPNEVDGYIKNKPIKEFCGIGKGYQEKLLSKGIQTLGEVKKKSRSILLLG